MLRALDDVGKSDWKAHLSRLMHVYNTMPHSITGHGPYFLMFGREPNLPVDALLPGKPCSDDNIEETKKRLKDAYRTEVLNNEQARRHQKGYYDLKGQRRNT